MASAVQWDDSTGEPYLDVPGHPGVRLTPYRDTRAEEDALIEISNRPDVGRWSYGRRYPLRAEPGTAVPTAPFSVVRGPDGAYLGEVYVWADAERPGVLEMSYSLLPDARGRGLGAASVRAVVGWAGRGMGAHTVEAMVETENAASSGLMAKLGFVRAEVRGVRWPKDKGGGVRECAFWRLDLA
ncbi:hypothetical protein Q8F55_006648 [Vanrija albida]|uniref:N-acetyltransferase domain-containing protein n=1 Tax=Vanrija albida TaxID=181172 RepID=A0ABR3PXS5_9TREE